MAVFRGSELDSGDGMLTTVWGPCFWHALHTMSFNYPVRPTCAQKAHYKAFMASLVHVLPCRFCRENLVKNYEKMPLTPARLASRATFSRYVYDLHELVNKMLKKKSGLSFAAVRERFEHFRARCTKASEDPPAEKGCTEPLYTGEKARCALSIVPVSDPCPTFQVAKACLKTRCARPPKNKTRRN